jgi:two-component system, sensor histidine kinase PdtaS
MPRPPMPSTASGTETTPAALDRRILESEERFRAMADHAPVLLWMARPNGECEFFNARWLSFTGRSMQEEVGNGWAEGVHVEDFQSCMHTFLEAFVSRRDFAMEYRLRRFDGEYRWIYDQGTPRFEPDGRFAGYIGSCIDITEQRRAQATLLDNAALAATLRQQAAVAREREVLLREVHHRVKNDLQLISSILCMQGRRLSEPRAIAALEDCESRVRAVAMVHELMYRADKPSRVSMASTIQNLAVAMFRITDTGGGLIALQVDVDGDQTLDVERAIPCALILNELITNAFKHAFPPGRAGTVSVALREARPGHVVLSVADDGVGISPEVDLDASACLGWRLIEALAEQLGAALLVDRSRGTRVELAFDSSKSYYRAHQEIASQSSGEVQ